ncbi:MAG: hypothetical protein ACFFDN_17625 [Candidatus Hodarchaeota archaeon]
MELRQCGGSMNTQQVLTENATELNKLSFRQEYGELTRLELIQHLDTIIESLIKLKSITEDALKVKLFTKKETDWQELDPTYNEMNLDID